MLARINRLALLSGKFARHAILLRKDPETFGKNLAQFTNPALYERRLLDVSNAVPMHVRFNKDVATPRLNVLDAAWTTMGMTGGPNTVINLAFRIARLGIPVRLVSTVAVPIIQAAWLQDHAKSLLGTGDVPEVPVVSAAQAAAPLEIGSGDIFLATHWTTAQQLKAVLPLLPHRQFFYMLQEFEPGFYGWSSNFALAVETYGLDFWPIINEQVLADYLLSQPFGRLAHPETRERAIVFEPAVDAGLFHPNPPGTPPHPKRLLFYARPTNSRNMFGLGLAALRHAAADPAFAGWEFLSIGSRGSIPDMDLGHGHVLRRAPWMDYNGYGDFLRQADILLCPMWSPHTSYPVLEMPACGGLAVTNTFVTKTSSLLHAMSPNIIPVEATFTGFSDGLLEAARRINAGTPRPATVNTPRSWGEALDPVAERVAQVFHGMVAG